MTTIDDKAERVLNRIGDDVLRARLAEARARIAVTVDDDERDRIVQRLAAKGHQISREEAHLAGNDDGYVWRHPDDGSWIATITRGPDPDVGTVHLLHHTAVDELTGGKRTTWGWYVVWSVTPEQMVQDVLDDSGSDLESVRRTTVLVPRVRRLPAPVLHPYLTTAQAAELAGTTADRLRALASDARRRHGASSRPIWPGSIAVPAGMTRRTSHRSASLR